MRSRAGKRLAGTRSRYALSFSQRLLSSSVCAEQDDMGAQDLRGGRESAGRGAERNSRRPCNDPFLCGLRLSCGRVRNSPGRVPGYADQEIGTGYDLDSIAAVAVGGAVLGGGRGRVSGTVAGVLLMAVLLNIVLLLKLKVEYQLVLRGLVILGAVAFYSANWAGMAQAAPRGRGLRTERGKPREVEMLSRAAGERGPRCGPAHFNGKRRRDHEKNLDRPSSGALAAPVGLLRRTSPPECGWWYKARVYRPACRAGGPR